MMGGSWRLTSMPFTCETRRYNNALLGYVLPLPILPEYGSKDQYLGITLTRFSYNKTFNVEGKAVYRIYMRNSRYRNVAHAYAVVFRDGREREHALSVEKMALPSLTVAPPTCAPPVMRQSAFLSNTFFN